METFYCNFCLNPLKLFQAKTTDSFSTSPQIKSYVTNCQHTFCQTCKEKCRPKCVICGNMCKLMQIDDSMPFHLRLLFQPMPATNNLASSVSKFRARQELLTNNKLKQMETFYMSKYEDEKRQYQLEANALKKRINMNKTMAFLQKYCTARWGALRQKLVFVFFSESNILFI